MRTTLDVDDDVLAAARTLAGDRGISIGRALSELARKALTSQRIRDDGDLPVFDVADDAPILTPEAVADALDD